MRKQGRKQMKLTFPLAILTLILASCATFKSETGALDALRQPLVELAAAISTEGAPASVIAAARNVVSTYDAIQ